jgi:folate-binding protein YgfZ
MDLLNDKLSRRGAICNLKGRVVSDLRVIAEGDNCLLAISAGMGEKVVELLNKYIVFSNAEIEMVDDNFTHYGLLGDTTADLINALFGSCPATPDAVVADGASKVIRLTGHTPRFEIWLAPGAHACHKTLKDGTQSGQPDDWLAEDILAGIIHIDPVLADKYTPQLLNYDLSGVIDFNKGCYTGQEIVARMHYLGNAKLRLFHATVDTDYAIQPTSVVTHSAEDTIKESQILSYVNQPQCNQLLVILPLAAVENDRSFLLDDQPGASLQVQSLSSEE